MQISSLTAFANLNGRWQNGEKVVFFARYIGYVEEGKYIEEIRRVDGLLEDRKRAGRGGYLRECELDCRIDSQAAQRYAEEYDNRRAKREGTGCGLRFHFGDTVRDNTVQLAFEEVLALYESSSPGVSPSMVRNFGIKLLYWADVYLPRLYPEGACIGVFPKFILSGEVKTQEYLFLYFLVELGCDVLHLNPEKDAAVGPSLLDLSCCCAEENRGMVLIPPYSHCMEGTFAASASVQVPGPAAGNPQALKPTEDSTQAERSGNVRLDPLRLVRGASGAGRVEGQQAASSQGHIDKPKQGSDQRLGAEPAVRITVPARGTSSGSSAAPEVPAVPAASAGNRRQLEYEELARLSPGIVMISVYDKKGQCFKTGSGVVVSEKGYILTNFHVACEGAYYGIRFEEEEKIYETDELIKYNQFHDLAVIRIDRHCTPIRVYQGGKELVRGQKVVAIGSPLGLFNSVSDGIISGFRLIDETSMIQFTAPISHGSSGGALLNLYGELVGVITAGFDDGQNINLAVDYKTVQIFARGFL